LLDPERRVDNLQSSSPPRERHLPFATFSLTEQKPDQASFNSQNTQKLSSKVQSATKSDDFHGLRTHIQQSIDEGMSRLSAHNTQILMSSAKELQQLLQ
jgi:hypothetical protein